ncbi:NACHT domain- and WD repeat-containing protein 1 [Astyanax mexicanus]|uniref:NACHT domain- and WD repeat-containing protein 1 n=1 Tax=Astyanax mexicanus TaxID=7994 RepID=UPI0020CADD7D|nr:NACHT domain- and WD repeat-containing protein 1 [Astyanax mexicanus]XP_049321831.1 NACHT domain- and WD repeat-containing protein 1 [Astyanax mexicanus]
MAVEELREVLAVKALRGHDTDCLQPQSNVVRLFISSTSSDLTSERNAFWDKIYPEIQDFCQSLGLVFEVVDFRWGVSDSVINDHMTVELCLQEIQLCQKLSVGPSFLALVGSQYGHRPIPRFISENEFELLLSKLSRKDQEGSMLLRQWFIKDSNSVPPKYVLQPISTHYPHYNDTGAEAGPQRDEDVVSWNLTEARLLQLLCTAALEAEKDGEMSAEQKQNFFKSMTEWEMEQGFLRTSQDNPSAVIFVRDLPPLKKSEQQKHTLKFLDVTADGLLDKEAQELLTKLKERIHSACADDPGFHHIELSKGAIDVNRKEHKEYLENFCKQIVSQLKGKISRQTAPPAVPGWLWLQQELLHHANLSKKQCAVFCGRDGLLGKICLVMWESSNMQHGPLVVSGPPGSGKTAVLCRLAQEMRAVLGPQAVVTLRLLGMSPLSSDVDSVLKSVCVQVCGAFNLAPPCPQTANSHDMLVRFFQSMLHKVSEQGDTLLLILDSLDHLPHANGGHKLRWLPKEIPPNIHLVVSTLADWSPCLESLKALNNDDKYFFQVEPLTLEEGQLITKAYMDKAGRRLTSEQVDAVLQSFQKTGSPLHLKLLLDMAKQWTSYTTLSDIRLGSSVQEVISLFLDALEGKHGKLFVCHALGYITLSRFGLSEAELQDILSLDNDVLAEVYQNRLPPNHTLLRFPPLLWALFRQDLGDHLVERWENGIAVCGFSLRQFIEIVKERYLSVELRVKMHTVLSEYFLGQWSQGQQKPILLHPLMTQLNADRKVPAQPLWFAEGIPNFRKLHELPFHLLHAGKWEELRQLLLGSLEWLYCKTLSCGVASVIQDFTFCTDVMDCPEIRLIRECFLLLKPTIDFIDGNIDSSLLCTEITARFQALAHAYPDLIGCLYSQCQDWFASCADPVLVPRCSFMEAPGGALKNTLNGFTKGVTAVDVCCEKSILTAGSEDGLLIVWDLKHLEVLHTFVAHTGVVECVKLINKGDQCLSAGRDGCIKKWSVCSGKQLYCIQAAESILPRSTELLHVLESRAVLLFSTHSQVKAWNVDTGDFLYEVDVNVECGALGSLGQEVAIVSSDGQLWLHDPISGLQKVHLYLTSGQELIVTSVLKLTKHGKILIASEEGSLILVSVSGVLANVELPAPASFMFTSDDEGTLFAGCERTLVVLHVKQNSVQRTQDFLHESTVLSAAFYSNGSKVITGSQDQIIRVWGLTTGQLLDSISGVGSPVMFISVYNNTIISASPSSSRLKLWSLDYDPKHRNQMCVPANCTNVVITKDGSTVHYIKEEDRSKVFTWSCAEGLYSDHMEVSSNVCCMELAQQKRLLFCGLRTGTIFIYPLAFAQETLCIPPPESMPEVRSMAISPREDRMAVAYEDAVCLFEITARDSFPCVEGPLQCYSLTLLHSPVSAMALLPDCRLLYGTLGGEVAVYDFKSATAAELDHHGAAITCVALSNWDTHALIGSEDCVQKLWNLHPLLLDHTMEYKGFYFEGVLCAVFSVNDKHVFTGSRDKTIKVWDVATGSLLYIQYVYAAIIRITPFKDGFVAVSQFGSFVKESFRCPDTLSPDYNPLRNFRAHYRVTSREKILEPPHTSLNKVMNYNPAQFNFVGMFKTKQSNTCVIL